jgi:hypothetical protein
MDDGKATSRKNGGKWGILCYVGSGEFQHNHGFGCQGRDDGAGAFFGRISPMRRIWAPTLLSFSSMCS